MIHNHDSESEESASFCRGNKAPDAKIELALNLALEAGYRHIDAAKFYMNEKTIGKVLMKWLDSGRIKREELFITTKLPTSEFLQKLQQHHKQREQKHHQHQCLEDIPVLDWLQYSRYHPPKLPRSLRQCPAKRTPGRLPRIPFTPPQLQTLENAYKTSNYLSAEDANNLAEALDLTNTRVKIWFQNRRARERREKREKEECYDSTLSSNDSSPEQEDVIDIE